MKSISIGLWLLILSVLWLGCQPRQDGTALPASTTSPAMTIQGQREYIVHQQVALVNEGSGKPEKQNIWVALIRSFPPYQEVQSMSISPNHYDTVVDEYGNQYAEFDFSGQPPGTTRIVSIDYRLAVNELSYYLSTCQGELPDEFTGPELHIESINPQITALASRLAQAGDTACQQVRAFYDYIGSELTYTFNGQNWGAQAALGPMGADCTEYTDLLLALSRARGIPGRYFEGLLVLDEGKRGLAQLEHAWPDVYLPGIGWTALDPTLGRKPADRETYFAHYTPDHIIVTLGVNPSVLRGSSYWTHLYWPGDSTTIHVNGEWNIEPVDIGGHQ